VIDRSGKKNVPRKMPAVQRLSEPYMRAFEVQETQDTTRTPALRARRHSYGQVRTSFMAAESLRNNQTSANGREVSIKNKAKREQGDSNKG